MKRETLAKKVRRLRTELKMSQGELAVRAALGIQTVSSIENNRNTPNKSTLRLIADALGVTLDELVGKCNS